MKRIAVMGFFERWPEKDMFPQSGPYVAWRHVHTGGVWYCLPEETYDVALKEKCVTCEGSGRYFDCASLAAKCPFRPWWGGLCRVCGKSAACPMCDGLGVAYTPTRLLRG